MIENDDDRMCCCACCDSFLTYRWFASVSALFKITLTYVENEYSLPIVCNCNFSVKPFVHKVQKSFQTELTILPLSIL